MAALVQGEAAASSPSIDNNSINAALPTRLSSDAFNRRALSPARHSTDAASSVSRSSNHRPSPIILPPKRLSEYEEYERRSNPRSGSNPGSNANTPNSAIHVERKRSFPFDMDARSSDGDDEPLSSAQQAPTPSSADGPQSDAICFCVKAPKVPRPRNAFILYRQHYQSQVVAENPGLANPDISKIIGQMWKGQDDKGREYWKGLAEQEKQHHRKQHPDYRYQPRRTPKVDARCVGRPILATADDEGLGGAGDGLDPNRCEKCGGRYIAPLPSARAVPMSARALNQPQSPLMSGRRSSGPQSAFPSIHGHGSGGEAGDDHLGRGFPSPVLLKHMPAPQQRDQPSRRPLPQHGRPVHVDVRDDYDHRAAEADQKRRRYDPPNPYAPRFDANENHIATPIHVHPQYRLPPRAHRQASSPPPPPSAGLVQYPNGGPGHGPRTGPGSPWMAPPPVLHRNSGQGGYAPQPTPRGQNFADGRHPDEREGYNGMPGRLPPIHGVPYGYHAASGPGNGLNTPLTAMASLSMRQPPTPTTATPMSARPPMSAIGVINGRASSGRRDQYPHRPYDFSDESLRLPPLMTNVSTPMSVLSQKQLQQQQLQKQLLESGHSSRLQSLAIASALVKNSTGLSVPGRMHDMHTYAVSPTPVHTTVPDKDLSDKDSQASGIRAMVLSIPYLVRLEYLRRMNPPLSTAARRGPIISIEGHNRMLTDDVSRIVEQVLRHSGECHLGVWSTSARAKKQSTDSGVGSTMGVDDDAGDIHIDTAKETAGADLLAEYQALVVAWRAKTQAIVRHVTAAIPAQSIEADDTGLVSPSPATSKSPDARGESKDDGKTTSGSGKPTPAASSRASTRASPRQSPMMPGSILAAVSPPRADQLLPIALITGGYSLSISDKYAMLVPIEDAYAPLDHWEWMAMMWRATAAPDLVIYVDCAPGEAGAADEPTVNTRAQEGVIVVHAGKAAAVAAVRTSEAGVGETGSAGEDKDWTDSRVLDNKTERRLTFEVLEWVRAFGSA